MREFYFGAGRDFDASDVAGLGEDDLVLIGTGWGGVPKLPQRAGGPAVKATLIIDDGVVDLGNPPKTFDAVGYSVEIRYDRIRILALSYPARQWHASKDGALNVFHHPDWPGAYGSVNLEPQYWPPGPIPIEAVALRARLLPDDPVPLSGSPVSGLGRHCIICHAATDLRFAFGHGWGDGDRIVRAGTDETIMFVEDDGGRFHEVGSYCDECIAANEGHGRLKTPEGLVYDRRRNRSVPAGEVSKPDVDRPHRPGPIARARRRYGSAAFEWQTLESEPDCAARLDRLRTLTRPS